MAVYGIDPQDRADRGNRQDCGYALEVWAEGQGFRLEAPTLTELMTLYHAHQAEQAHSPAIVGE